MASMWLPGFLRAGEDIGAVGIKAFVFEMAVGVGEHIRRQWIVKDK